MNKIQVNIIVGFVLVLLVAMFLWFQSTQSVSNQLLEPLLITSDESESSLLGVGVKESIEEPEVHEIEIIYVDLKGAVAKPGVYALPLGSRLFDVIEMAGGLLPDAATQSLNQALLLNDQMLIYIFTHEEYAAEEEENMKLLSIVEEDSGLLSQQAQLVNINKANASELETLPGIGPKKASAILQFRQENGSFKGIEGLLEVSGIGQKTFDQLAPFITVD
ncbi:helix-hairpin-helix domain-containing protein [Fundicoccus ignavus]|nr:helix-hairpin-helix domain-containing protein [Fundicoccus ignavus]